MSNNLKHHITILTHFHQQVIFQTFRLPCLHIFISRLLFLVPVYEFVYQHRPSGRFVVGLDVLLAILGEIYEEVPLVAADGSWGRLVPDQKSFRISRQLDESMPGPYLNVPFSPCPSTNLKKSSIKLK